MIPSPTDLTEYFILTVFFSIILGYIFVRLPFLMTCKWKSYGIFSSCLKRRAEIEPNDDISTVVKYMTWSRIYISLDKYDFHENSMAKVY